MWFVYNNFDINFLFQIVVLALIRWALLGSLFSAKQLEILDDPLIKLRCPRQQLQQQPSVTANSPRQLESQDNVVRLLE